MTMLATLAYLFDGTCSGPVPYCDVPAYCYMNARQALDTAGGCDTSEGRTENLERAAYWQRLGANAAETQREELHEHLRRQQSAAGWDSLSDEEYNDIMGHVHLLPGRLGSRAEN